VRQTSHTGAFHPNAVARRGQQAARALGAVFLILLGAFFRAQVLDHESYLLKADANRLREIPVPSARAMIYDRDDRVIAENVVGYSVSLLASREDTLRLGLQRLGAYLPLSADQIERAVRRWKVAKTRPVVVLADAGFDDVSVLEEHRAALPGLVVQSAPKRYYPDGPVVESVVGYVGEPTDAELARNETYKAGQDIGKSGLEREYDERLRGHDGARYVEVDARGHVVADVVAGPETAPTEQAPLTTNIDLDLQRYVAALFGDSLQGGVVALEPTSGAVLALYSAPSYDPNRFIGGIPEEYWKKLTGDPRRPLYNKVLQGRYPPGSTFKLATAAIALQDKQVTLDERMPQPCTGGYMFGGRYFHCHDPKGHGDITLERAIEVSCDVYFYQLGLRMGLSRLVAGGISLGFDKRAGIDLPDEARPLFPTDGNAYFDRRYGPRGWTNAVTLNLSIGQGENAQTVLGMARFYTALATDGQAATPRIVKGEAERSKLFTLSEAQLAGLRQAMAGVVERGTAATAALKDVAIAGKTGTAQNGFGPDKTHAWFVGFAPIQHPSIVVAVMLEFGGEGPRAARIASKIVAHYLGVPVVAVKNQ
jgi:penicillin-binding protein 2